MIGFLVYVQWGVTFLCEWTECLPFCRSSVTSRKFTMVLFASIVIFRSFSRKSLHSPFWSFQFLVAFCQRSQDRRRDRDRCFGHTFR